jgi:hypothetical protein
MTFKRIILAGFCAGLLAAPALAQVIQPAPPDNTTNQPPGKTPLSPGNPYRGNAGPGTAPLTVPADQPRAHQGADAAHSGYGNPPALSNPNVAPTPDQ